MENYIYNDYRKLEQQQQTYELATVKESRKQSYSLWKCILNCNAAYICIVSPTLYKLNPCLTIGFHGKLNWITFSPNVVWAWILSRLHQTGDSTSETIRNLFLALLHISRSYLTRRKRGCLQTIKVKWKRGLWYFCL